MLPKWHSAADKMAFENRGVQFFRLSGCGRHARKLSKWWPKGRRLAERLDDFSLRIEHRSGSVIRDDHIAFAAVEDDADFRAQQILASSARALRKPASYRAPNSRIETSVFGVSPASSYPKRPP